MPTENGGFFSWVPRKYPLPRASRPTSFRIYTPGRIRNGQAMTMSGWLWSQTRFRPVDQRGWAEKLQKPKEQFV